MPRFDLARAAHMWERELVLVTGKGGVGKTTICAGLARAAKQKERRVLVAEVTSELGHQSPLLRLFGRPVIRSEEPVELTSGLFGVRVTPSIGHRLFLRAALRVGPLVDAAMRSAALRRFLLAAPAFPEIGTLYHLVTLLRRRAYDHIIVDLPATGHALGLVSLPRTILKVLPASGLIGNAIREGLDAITDRARTGTVIVTLPETLPVTEAYELCSGLDRLQVPVSAMILNQVPENPFHEGERAALRDHLAARKKDRPLLGGREFLRLERALDARARFYELLPSGVPGLEVPLARDQTDPGGVVEHVALHLRRLVPELPA